MNSYKPRVVKTPTYISIQQHNVRVGTVIITEGRATGFNMDKGVQITPFMLKEMEQVLDQINAKLSKEISIDDLDDYYVCMSCDWYGLCQHASDRWVGRDAWPSCPRCGDFL